MSHLRVSSRQHTLVLSSHPAPIPGGRTWACEPLYCWQVPFAPSLRRIFSIFLQGACLAAHPSEVPELPLPPPVRGLPSVWEPFHLQGSLPGAQVPAPQSSVSLVDLSFVLPHSKEIAFFLEVWGPLPVLRSCSMGIVPHADDFLIYLLGQT